ncbi:hypothetical protein U9M48_040921 [Paspalum notatum var. saurae]|uniref:Cathepsin propeptide inhibitor domain-containing protein n=1 Tax=Paspalum notatum var. saurae TaxID=547442 RepID=A0AAQ3UP98_PASNO
MVFKGNRRVVVELNAAAAADGEETAAYGLNRFGDLTNEEVRGCGYDGRGGECQANVAAGDDGIVVYGDERLGKFSARCQAAVAGDDTAYDYKKRIRYQVDQVGFMGKNGEAMRIKALLTFQQIGNARARETGKEARQGM